MVNELVRLDVCFRVVDACDSFRESSGVNREWFVRLHACCDAFDTCTPFCESYVSRGGCVRPDVCCCALDGFGSWRESRARLKIVRFDFEFF